jgi:hypothetical protein
MRTSLNEIKLIEDYLHGALPDDESVVIEARTIIDRGFWINIAAQLRLYKLITAYGRLRAKQDIHAAERECFSQPEFAEEINNIFNHKK